MAEPATGGAPRGARGAPIRVCVNGELVSRDEVVIPTGDLGFGRGYGVFETVYHYPGGYFELEPHLERLEESARILRIPCPPRQVLRDGLQLWHREVGRGHAWAWC